MYQVIIVFHVLLGLGIIGLVLMQQGKGADAGAAFGAGASGTVFGAQGAASFLSRTTAIFATLFFTTSLGLAVYNSHKGVAYDLLSDQTGEQDSLSIPDSQTGKIVEQADQSAPPVEEKAQVSNSQTEKTADEEKPIMIDSSPAKTEPEAKVSEPIPEQPKVAETPAKDAKAEKK